MNPIHILVDFEKETIEHFFDLYDAIAAFNKLRDGLKPWVPRGEVDRVYLEKWRSTRGSLLLETIEGRPPRRESVLDFTI